MRHPAPMLTLSLFRHAKSSWDDPSLEDFDRPLGPRGLKAAPQMGAFMAEQKLRPDLVLCSPAQRTRETLDLVAEEIGRPRTVFPDKLYLAAPETLLAAVQATTGGVRHLMMVGHNPGLHMLALLLMGPEGSADAGALRTKFPTAGLAVLTFSARAWRDIGPGSGRLKLFMTPKRLP